MKIAIDIDNTILRCKSTLYKLASKFEQLSFVKIPGKERYFKRGESHNFSSKYRRLFGKLGNVDSYEEIDGSKKIINKFSGNGSQVVFLSSRPNIKFFNDVMLEWLKNNEVPYDFIVINCKNKSSFCKDHGIDLLIDDSLPNCLDANKNGIPTIWLNSTGKKIDSQKISNLKNFYIAKDWNEIDKIFEKFINENSPSGTEREF